MAREQRAQREGPKKKKLLRGMSENRDAERKWARSSASATRSVRYTERPEGEPGGSERETQRERKGEVGGGRSRVRDSSRWDRLVEGRREVGDARHHS